MAGDWIKVCHVTPDKPEVWKLAELLNMDPDAVLGKLMRIWIWADQQTIDGNATSVTLALLNRISGVTGFAEAMLNDSVKWLKKDEEGNLLLPNFDNHNGETAKKRAQANKRQARHRAGLGDCKTDLSRHCHAVSVTKASTREEKRREDNINTLSETKVSNSCPAQEIIGLYHKILPELPAVRTWKNTDKRAKHLAARWKESEQHQTLDFWEWFFTSVRNNPHWLGQNQRGWRANLEWLVNRTNFLTVAEQ